jgi:hypothetical protein
MLENIKRNLIFVSPDPTNVFCYSPSIHKTATSRLITTFDLGGPGVEKLDGVKGSRDKGTKFGQGKIYISDDDGRAWTFVDNFPFWHARIIEIKNVLYIMGHSGDLMVIKSVDNGNTWSKPVKLTTGRKFHCAPCNYLIYKKFLYFSIEERIDLSIKGWNTAGLVPLLIKININKDLLDFNNYEISNDMTKTFNKCVLLDNTNYFGFPFYDEKSREPIKITDNIQFSPSGWLEGNVVKIFDKNHIWFDRNHNIIYNIMRASIGLTNYACLVKFIIEKNKIYTEIEKTYANTDFVFINIPGGHLKFHILHDKKSKLYWMVSSQSTDSMIKPEVLENMTENKKRYNLPDNQRNRLQLSFSKNLKDWCPAGIIYKSNNEKYSRNYPAFIIDNNDIYVAAKGGDKDSLNSQYGNLIEMFKITNFRKLVY